MAADVAADQLSASAAQSCSSGPHASFACPALPLSMLDSLPLPLDFLAASPLPPACVLPASSLPLAY